jgi:hypothetical protein
LLLGKISGSSFVACSSLWFACCLFAPSCGHNWGKASLLRGIYAKHSHNNLVRCGAQILTVAGTAIFISFEDCLLGQREKGRIEG